MKLNKIELKDFRQFYGEQTIDFSTDDRNITIIFGENGKGKTSIFRALMFGLFGSRYLSQDDEKEEIHLVNFNKLEENLNKPVQSKVSITFEDKDKSYIIERKVSGYKSNNIIKETIENAELYLIDELGNFNPEPITDQDLIKDRIDQVLNRKIKDFFLFDGEKIDTLAKTNKTVRKEIKNGIIKLLDIDKLDRAINILDSLYNKETKRIEQNTSNIDIKKSEQKKANIQQHIKDLEEKLEEKQNNKEWCENEIERTKRKLAKDKEIKKIQEKYDEIQQKIKAQNNTLSIIKQSLKDSYLNSGHQFFMEDIYMQVKNYLEPIYIEQNDIIPFELLEKILKEKECICGTKLDESSLALEKINNLKSNFSRGMVTPIITMINGIVKDYKNSKEETMIKIKHYLEQINNYKEILKELEKEKDNIKFQIKESSQKQKNLKELEQNLEKKEDELHNLKEEIIEIVNSIKEANNNLDTEKKKYQELVKKDKNLKYDYKRLKYIERLNNNFKAIFTEYSDKMRNKLMREITNIFKQLIDGSDKDLLKRIEINDRYEMELINWSENQMNQDISQGQRQIVSLSFITALAKVSSGKGNNVSFPLFMDTPFGRLSGNNRDNLIEKIPDLTSQWVLLLTDTEFSKSEEIKIKQTGKLGKWYVLEQVKNGYTKIVEKELDESIATRR